MSINVDKLKADDFKGMKYSIFKPEDKKNQSFKKIYPDLRQYDEFNIRITNTFPKNKFIDYDMLFKYVALMYDMNSPFTKFIDATNERKRYVLFYIGAIPELNSDLDETWTKITQNKYFFISQMILRYCMLQRSVDYTYYTMSSERLYKYLVEGMNDVQKAKECANIRKEVQESQERFLAGKDQSLSMDLERYIGELQIPISPEEIAAYKGDYPYEHIPLKHSHEIVDPFQAKYVKKETEEVDESDS